MNSKPPCRCALPWLAAGLVLVGAVVLFRWQLGAERDLRRSRWWD